MRNWLNFLDEIDLDCVEQYEHLLGRPLRDHAEYLEIDEQVNEMILEWETPEEFFAEYPELKKYAASAEKRGAIDTLNAEQLVGTLVDYHGYYCEVISVDDKTIYLQNTNNDMHFEISHSAFKDQATRITNDDERLPLQNYDDAVSYLCEVLNKEDAEVDMDNLRTPLTAEDFIPIFKSTNYFGIYCYHTDHYYSGENEYYLVDRNTGEHKMVLGESFEFIGQNLLDCMKTEEILHVANTEWLQYLVDFSLNNVKDIVPLQELQGIATLQTALRKEKCKTHPGAYYPKPSLADQIADATGRKTPPVVDPVMSVARFAENAAVKDSVLQSDALRNQVLNLCSSIPGYSSLSKEDKNQLYDLVKKAVSGSRDKSYDAAPER